MFFFNTKQGFPVFFRLNRGAHYMLLYESILFLAYELVFKFIVLTTYTL